MTRRKEAVIRAAYAGRMWHIPAYGGLHRLMTILAVVLVALSGGGGHGAATAGLTPTMICSDGAMRTVWLDAEGRAHSAPMGCEACPDCALPLVFDPGRAPDALRPAGRIWNDRPTFVEVSGALSFVVPQSRGPPPFASVRLIPGARPAKARTVPA